MIVYIVMAFDYEDTVPESVWSCLEAAEAHVAYLEATKPVNGVYEYSVLSDYVCTDNFVNVCVPKPFEVQ